MTEHVHDDVAPSSVADIDAENGSWNHLLPVEDWERVVAEAERIYAERVAAETERGGSDLMPLGLTPRVVKFPDTYGKNSGSIVRQQLWVLHSAECPLRAGYAESLTKWGNGGYQPRASWQRFIDPATRVDWIPNNKAAFLHGPANSLGMGWEQAGYARFTRAEWLTPDGLRQLDLLAQDLVKCGITVDALRWLTDAQVKAIVDRKDTKTRGLCTHAQIDKAVQAGLRTDPGAGYPKDVLLTWIRSYHPGVPEQTPPGTSGTVRLGDRGEQVATVQRLLVAHGYDLDPDGVFGAKTDAAVRDFQTRNNLDVDGVVGSATIAALKEDDLMATKDDLRAIVREEIAAAFADEARWRRALTGMAFFKDPTAPNRGESPDEPRIPLGRLMEIAGIAALEAKDVPQELIRAAVADAIKAIDVTVRTDTQGD